MLGGGILKNNFYRKLCGMLAAFFSAVAFGFWGALPNLQVSSDNSIYSCFLTVDMGTLVLVFIIAVFSGSFKNFKCRPFLTAVIFGGLSAGVAESIYIFQSEQIGSGLSQIIFCIHSVFLLLLSLVMKKHKSDKASVFAAVIIVLGAVMLVFNKNATIYVLLSSSFILLLGAFFYGVSCYATHDQKMNNNLSVLAFFIGGVVVVFTSSCLYSNAIEIPELPLNFGIYLLNVFIQLGGCC